MYHNLVNKRTIDQFILKFWGSKYIKVLDKKQFQFRVKVQELKTYLTLIIILKGSKLFNHIQEQGENMHLIQMYQL